MNILALETSSQTASVALLAGERVFLAQVAASAGASSQVLPLVTRLLAQAGLTMAQLDAIAYGAGPGAFTGVRVACALAQGLAFGLKVPVVGINTLEALAEGVRLHQPVSVGACVYAAIDARMDELYVAAYTLRADQTWQTVIEPQLVARASAPAVPAGAIVVGNGMDAVDAVMPSAQAVARLAARVLQATPHPSAQFAAKHAQPLYLRNKVAFTSDERARGLHRPHHPTSLATA